MSSIEETLRRIVREEVHAALAEWEPPAMEAPKGGGGSAAFLRPAA